jgi:hypothetical protein
MYMAPEQASGRDDAVGPAADQFALAIIVYEMLTGEHPFAADIVTKTLLRVISFEPKAASAVAPWIPPAVDSVLYRALAKDEARRFPAIKDFVDALIAACGYHPRRSSMRPRRVGETVPGATRLGLKDAITEPAETLPCTGAPVQQLLGEIDAARAAFLADDIRNAVQHACNVVTIAQAHEDDLTERVLRVSERLLETIFVARVGSEQHQVSLQKGFEAVRAELCPKEAFLLSRVEPGVRVEDVLDMAAMPRLQALAALASLMEKAAISTTDRAAR